MSYQLLGLLIGGVVPALCYGISSIFAKTSANAGMSIGGHLFFIGLAISAVGVIMNLWLPGEIPSLMAVGSSTLQGVFWGLGTGGVVLGILKYQAPLSKLVPLYNMNTLITVGLALVLFAEWQQVNPVLLWLGTVLVMLGGILVSIA